MPSFGEQLRAEREKHDTTLEEIAAKTQIGLSYLEALENDEFEALPGRNFGKLYIRAYGETLGFDPQPLIDVYDREFARRSREGRKIAPKPAAARKTEAAPPEAVEECPEEPVETETPPLEPGASGSRSRRIVWLLLSVAAVIVLAWLWITLFRAKPPVEDRPAPIPASSETFPEPQPAVPVQTAALGPPPANGVETTPARLSVTEFGVGRRIVDRRLVDRGDRFEEGAVVFFSTRVLGGEAGDRIRHVWLREGRPVQKVDLELGGPHWRTHSRKTLWGVGPWAVEARDPEGQVLARTTFTCTRVES